MFLDLAMKYLDFSLVKKLMQISMFYDEAVLERALVTLARIYSSDRANVYAEGNLGVLYKGSASHSFSPFPPDACQPRYCLKNVNNSIDMNSEIIQRFQHGDILQFAGEQQFDEPHVLSGMGKFVLVTVVSNGQRYLTDMILQAIRPTNLQLLPTRKLFTRPLNAFLNDSSGKKSLK